jgi:hypothetical protein
MPVLSTRELRKFGLTVGIAFAVLGAVSWWRGHVWPPRVLGTLGVLLFVPGLLAPRLLAPVERAWMAFATVLGRVNTRIILGLIFYLVVTPVGLVMRLFRDPLNRKQGDPHASQWIKRAPEPVDPARYQRQF